MVIKQRCLMNKEYLKEYSLLPINFNTDEIWNFIPLAEQLHIVPIIGQEMYKELLDQVENNEVTPENASLLLQIYPFEGLAIMEVSMPYIAYHITEVGITKGSSENSDSVTTNEKTYWARLGMDSAGDGVAHNNMPPYLVVYIWKRVTFDEYEAEADGG